MKKTIPSETVAYQLKHLDKRQLVGAFGGRRMLRLFGSLAECKELITNELMRNCLVGAQLLRKIRCVKRWQLNWPPLNDFVDSDRPVVAIPNYKLNSSLTDC